VPRSSQLPQTSRLSALSSGANTLLDDMHDTQYFVNVSIGTPTWTGVGVCTSGVFAAGKLAHTLRAGIVLTVADVAIIVSVIKVLKARGSDAAKSSLSDI
jgi:hypothetical protein